MSLERPFDEIYADVPDKQRRDFVYFRQTHPYSRTMSGDTPWKYIDTRNGDDAVLLLVGGLREADAAWRSIPMLEDGFRVIAPSYPTLDTMSALADGLAAILDAANVEKAHVLAGSFGGMLAQVFIRRHPNRVKSLILSTTAVLDDDNITQYKQAISVLEPMDESQVAQMAQATMFDIIAPPEEYHAFYRAYLDELYSYRVDKDALLSTYRALIDFAENITLSADDLAGWGGRVLILESDDDATFDESIRARVRELYPGAQSHVFHGAGHSPGTTQRDLYFKVVRDFFAG